jgi:hypothetical protein
VSTAVNFVGETLPKAFADMSPDELGSRPSQRGMVDVGHLTMGRWVSGMVKALASEDPAQTLADHFDSWAPATAGEVVGIEARLPWHSEPALHYALPWDSGAPGVRWKTRRENLMAQEAEASGMVGWSADLGWKGFGPATAHLVEMEVGRLLRVRDSIAREGFMIANAPGATPFVAGEQVRFRPRVGFHRLAAAIALGYEQVPVTASWRQTVKLADAPTWRNVVNESYTLDEAVRVFADTFWDRGV